MLKLVSIICIENMALFREIEKSVPVAKFIPVLLNKRGRRFKVHYTVYYVLKLCLTLSLLNN